MRKWIFFMMLCIWSLQLFSNKQDTVSVKLLSDKTLVNIANNASQNTETDSHRVANIYYWMTHNIKRDTKSFNKEEKLKYNNSKEILKTKTAHAREYAQMVKDLCEIIGVKAMVIVGYKKNELYESGAGFYNPNHAWNAVFINNKWELLDACTGAGNIYMDLSFGKKILSKLNKKKLQTSTKIKFVFEYKPEYLFQNPEEVRLSRVPIDPLWQLTDTIMPLFVFEQSEDDIIEFNEKYSKLKQYDLKLIEIFNLNDDEYIIECAERTFAYNPRYTEMKANKHIALANENIKKLKTKTDKVETKEIKINAKIELDNAKNVLNNQKKEIATEYATLRKVNNEKRTSLTKYKQQFTSSNNKHLSVLNNKINAAAIKPKTLQTDTKTKSEIIKDISFDSYRMTKTLKPERDENDVELLKLKDSIMVRNNKSTIAKENIINYKNQITSDKEMLVQTLDSMNAYIKLTNVAFNKESIARSAQQGNYEDSIKINRSKLTYYKINKSDEFQNQYFYQYDTILKVYELIKKEYNSLIDASKKNAKDLIGIKKMSSKNDLESTYQANVNDYKEAIAGYINNNLSTNHFIKSELKNHESMKKMYTAQNNYFNFLNLNEDERKSYVKKILLKSESIDKKHNEQKKELITKYKEDLDAQQTNNKKTKKRK